MPEKKTLDRARKDARQGKSPSTQAGECVREEMDHIREGKHGARSTKQAIAIGLSKARRAGVKLAPPKKGKASEKTRKQAERNYAQGQTESKPQPSPTRSGAVTKALQREGKEAASPNALSHQAHSSAKKRSAASRKRTARKAAHSKSRTRSGGRLKGSECVRRQRTTSADDSKADPACRWHALPLYSESVPS